MTSGVYTVRCAKARKTYVGASADVETRWQKHRYALTAGAHKNRHLQQAWEKHGPSAFAFWLVEETTSLVEAEQRWLTKLDAVWPRGFNMCPSTKSVIGITRSDETKTKMSTALKGRTFSASARRKMSSAARGRPSPRRGVKLSLEVRKKISDSVRAVNQGERR